MIDSFNFEEGFFDSKALFSPYHRTQIWADGKLLYDSGKKRQFKKPNNNVPKNIKGDYDLSIHGNKIVLVDNKDGTTVEAKCHPDDNFDIGEGIRESFRKMNEKREKFRQQEKEKEDKIKVGDWVKVVRPGASYYTLSDYFEKYGLKSYAPYYRYGVIPFYGAVGQVVFVDGRTAVIRTKNDKVYGATEWESIECTDGVYIVGFNGLRKVEK